MPYFDESGNQVDGLLTQEELDAKLEEERAALKAEHDAAEAASQQRIGALEAEKAAAQAAVDKAVKTGDNAGGDADTNLVMLRKKLEETNAALESERSSNNERYQTIEEERISQAIRAVAGNDEEMAKKIRHNYDTMLSAVKATTAEQVAQKVASAAKLSVDASTPNPLDIARSGASHGAPRPAPVGNAKPFTPVEIASGKMLGITDQDRAKYANDPRLSVNRKN